MKDKNAFFKIPKQLFTDERFCGLSSYAKLLYGLMLDRMSLSEKNGWKDENGRVYIYYTQKDVMECLGVGRAKAIGVFAELDNAGLIHRKRQGMGKPLVIYVSEIESSVKVNTSSSVKNKTSSSQKNEHQDVFKTDTNKTDINNTDINNTDIISCPAGNENEDEMDSLYVFIKEIRRNIDYDALVSNYGKEKIDCIIDIILDALCGAPDYITVGGIRRSFNDVKTRLLELNNSHIEYVFECLDKCKSDIMDIKRYMLTSLYNAPKTIDAYYQNQLNSDMRMLRSSA